MLQNSDRWLLISQWEVAVQGFYFIVSAETKVGKKTDKKLLATTKNLDHCFAPRPLLWDQNNQSLLQSRGGWNTKDNSTICVSFFRTYMYSCRKLIIIEITYPSDGNSERNYISRVAIDFAVVHFWFIQSSITLVTIQLRSLTRKNSMKPSTFLPARDDRTAFSAYLLDQFPIIPSALVTRPFLNRLLPRHWPSYSMLISLLLANFHINSIDDHPRFLSPAAFGNLRAYFSRSVTPWVRGAPHVTHAVWSGCVHQAETLLLVRGCICPEYRESRRTLKEGKWVRRRLESSCFISAGR